MIKISKKEYPCLLEYALTLIKGKWKSMIICTLNNRVVRFGKLKKELNLSHKVLTENLKELAKDKLVKRTVYPEIPPKVDYELTDQGRKLFEAMLNIRGWAEEYVKVNNIEVKELSSDGEEYQ